MLSGAERHESYWLSRPEGGSSALLHLEVKTSTSLAFRNHLLRVRACRARQRNALLLIHSSRLHSSSEIQDVLVKHGATGVLEKYEQGTSRIEA